MTWQHFIACWCTHFKKTIDQALSALRAGTPSQADAKAALEHLAKTFDGLQGRSQAHAAGHFPLN